MSAELLSVEPADVNVTVTDGRLVIKGEKKAEAEKEDKGKDWRRVERSYGSFQRAIDLPLALAEDKVSAEFSKGVFKVTLFKAPAAQAAPLLPGPRDLAAAGPVALSPTYSPAAPAVRLR